MGSTLPECASFETKFVMEEQLKSSYYGMMSVLKSLSIVSFILCCAFFVS